MVLHISGRELASHLPKASTSDADGTSQYLDITEATRVYIVPTVTSSSGILGATLWIRLKRWLAPSSS
ncbi:MAG: hypothetical protein H7A19_11620 [Rhodanobacteraceae bacterium]|nr:hypothetical protein [Rhodanobacteraceae bacterium]